MNLIDIPNFIRTHITKRDHSFFQSDIETNNQTLWNEIKNKSILVIGGAGTIGSSFIKAILKFEPQKLCGWIQMKMGLPNLLEHLEVK